MEINQSTLVYRLLNQEEAVPETLHALSEESFAFGSPWTIEQFQSTFDQANLFYLVAEYEGEMVGFLGGSKVHTEAEVYTIVVKTAYKRNGIATQLLKEMKQRLRAERVNELFLEVRISNEPAILLYKKSGFIPVGVRKGYYAHPKEDAVVLKCAL
ncbi:ribosomal protein S18-alanine N-acetyltransferase [Marinilactibacillus kalidii]|uniref:ribosomal protein S18-alanine N-acetyltransferase n=1 Tax=Marinilactibacillus kalidii TaxID=2820274 RepID=UPI001ABE27F3|nr:ribosomal protein S18-alanine N-acetyltransferase [Marinilactibacillus kalidii]